jgi:two-component system, NtrC family, sensor histidine kinase HydH
MRIRHIATRFAIVLAIAAMLPLVAYGLWSLFTLQRGTRDSVVTGNLNVATRAAEEIRRYIVGDAEILKALGADLQNAGLQQWQQDRILKNYALQFREFRELTLFDESGQVIATSRATTPRVAIPSPLPPAVDSVAMSPIRIDEDQLPTTTFAIHLTRLNQPSGWLVGEFSLEQMWRMVDEIRIGAHGYALVVAPDGTLVAHGNPDKKALIAQSKNLKAHPLLTASAAPWQEYRDEDGREQLGVAARINTLNWTVIVEQPTAEAYASAARLERQLMIAATLALLVMIGAGFIFGRRFIAPIFALKRGTQALSEGKLETRVDIQSADEFGQLGASFNSMANRLVELQENVKRQERQAMFGRVVAGLFHDLNHPIQNIGNNARLLLREDLDPEGRNMSQRIIERELGTLKRFMDDVLNIAKPRPIERFTLDVNTSVGEIVESMRAEGERANVTVSGRYAEGPLPVEGDRFALGRVYRNLITNAIQATAPGGSVTVTTARAGGAVEVTVADTGTGIPADRLTAIFDDFVTTKRRGLGLGLATSKRIIEQLDGTISVQSEVGRGTAFTVRLPATNSRTAAAAS